MIAQDTGSAITGPARADLYFGAGADAGKVSGRLRHNMHFVILVPKSLDPMARGRKMPVPDPRPSAQIAKLFPQVDPLKDQKAGAKPAESSTPPGAKGAASAAPPATSVAQASATQAAVVKPVPLPEARPNIQASGEVRRYRHYRYYRRVR